MDASLKKLSPAKINLYLEIKSRRTDGYHNIESLMIFCEFGDYISVRPSDKFNFSVEGPFSSTLKDKPNLIHKSIDLLQNFYGREFAVDVCLNKNLPISSGMAGGSSNAATFIRCIKEIYNLKELNGFKNLLLSLGADVPFCYYGKTAVVTGIGENIEFISNVKDYYILLINPKIEFSTKEIFQSLEIDNKKENREFEIPNGNPECFKYFSKKRNDLEFEAIKKDKIIEKILKQLSCYDGTLLSRMTGSGATCFALFECFKDLKKAELDAKKEFRNCWIKSTRLMNSIKHI